MRIVLTSSALAVLLAMAGRAAAQPVGAERALAEGLFQDGRNLLAAGNVAEACKKFAASYRIDPAGGTLMNLARCHEREGRTATAWAEFKDALVVAVRAGNQVRQTEAQERVTALEGRLARILIAPPREAVAGLEVRIDNVPVDADGRSALPVDPGPHTVSVTAPGRKAWRSEVLAKEGVTQPISVPALDVAGPGVGSVARGPVGGQTHAVGPLADPETPAVEGTRAQPWRRPVAVALMASGGVAVVIGAAFAADAHGKFNTLSQACPSHVSCDPSLASELSSYHTASAVSTAGFVVAGALFGTGLVVFLTSPKAEPRPAAFVAPRVGLGSLGLEGTFR